MIKQENLLEYIEDLGLKVNEESGGHQSVDTDKTPQSIVNNSLNEYTLHFDNGEKVDFLNSAQFLKAIVKTEKSLNIALFV